MNSVLRAYFSHCLNNSFHLGRHILLRDSFSEVQRVEFPVKDETWRTGSIVPPWGSHQIAIYFYEGILLNFKQQATVPAIYLCLLFLFLFCFVFFVVVVVVEGRQDSVVQSESSDGLIDDAIWVI